MIDDKIIQALTIIKTMNKDQFKELINQCDKYFDLYEIIGPWL
jgi:hypothetical protein